MEGVTKASKHILTLITALGNSDGIRSDENRTLPIRGMLIGLFTILTFHIAESTLFVYPCCES